MRRLHIGWFFFFVILATLAVASTSCGCEPPYLNPCIPTTCEEAGASCGSINDDCDGRINCGYCGAGYVCGLYEANACGYTGEGGDNGGGSGDDTNPLTGCAAEDCIDLGVECGTYGDGCGRDQTCGFCGGGLTCGGGHEPGICGQSVCVPTTCDAVGAECGNYPDGCGGILDCGFCEAGQTCGGGGAYRCGTGTCTPNPNCNGRCGYVTDGCAGVTSCPGCAPSEVCASGTCRPGAGSVGNPCSNDSSCGTGHCLTQNDDGWHGGYCSAPCGSNADCGDGNVCGYLGETGSGICLSACTNDSQCREGYVCAVPEGGFETACIPGGTGNGGVSAPCRTSADCDDGEDGFCLRAEDGFPGGYCTAACGEGGDCPAGSACAFDSAGRGICVKLCSDHSDCSGDYRCRDVGGFTACWPAGNLGEGCLTHDDCASDVCLSTEPHGWPGGYCTDLCNSNADCGTGNQCLPYGPNGQFVCVQGCASNSDCRDGYSCTITPNGSRACLPYGSGTGQIGDPCTTAMDCAGGEDAICVSTPAGGRCSIRCSTSQDCPAGETCVTDGGVVPGFCQLPDKPIDNCSSDQDCGTGRICVQTPAGRICGNICNSDGDCPTGMRCTSDEVFGGGGFCQPVSSDAPGGGGAGGPCSHGDDCDSGICITSDMGYPGGYCAEPCSSNADCEIGEVCGPGGPAGQSICMPECGSNRDCRPGYECVDVGGGTTACSPERGDGQAGDTCQTSEDCAAGHVCVETYSGQNECAETCLGAGDCDDGMACRPSGDGLETGTCQPGSEHGCSSDADCPPGQTCGVSMATQTLTCMPEDEGGIDWGFPEGDDWGGPKKTGDPCSFAHECENMQCYPENTTGWAEGYCTGMCSDNQDCSEGSICGLKRVLEITMDSGGGLDIKDVTDLFGYDPGMGVTFDSGAATKLLMKLIMKWIMDSLFGDFEGKVTIGQCLKSCSSDGDCRFGYKCIQVDSDGTRGCIPFADGPGQVGDSCSLIPDCSGGLPGLCLMNDSGYPDGYCSLNCKGNASICPAGSRCVKLSDDQSACMRTTPCDLDTLGAICDWWQCFPDSDRCWVWDEEDSMWVYDSSACCGTGRSCTPFVPCPINQEWECTAHQRRQTGFCSQCVGTERCRPDYACYAADNRLPGVCYPSAKGSRGIGQTCSKLRDCLYGVDGVCFVEADTGEDTPPMWQDGYCARSCDGCPSGSTCALLITGGEYCMKSCSWNGQCRTGYTCEIVSKHRRVKRLKCRTKTNKACVPTNDIVEIQLTSSWLCSDPK